MTDKDQFIKQIEKLNDANSVFRLIASKPREGSKYRSATYEVYQNEKGELKIQVVFKSMTQHFTRVIERSELMKEIIHSLNNEFYYCEIFAEEGNAVLLQNQKGTSTLIQKRGFTELKLSKHDKQKKYHLPENLEFLQRLGISSSRGRVYEHCTKKYKQINKYIEIIESLIKTNTKGLKIVDMGSGKAYLSFALYYYLKYEKNIEVTLTGYELRQELVDECNKIASELKFENLSFIQANIEEVNLKKIDFLVSLHACDIATDMAIKTGIFAKAKYMVFAPCCHKQVRKQMMIKNGITKHGILEERQAEIITDAIRALILEDNGYSTKVFEFISPEHTSKNIMITAFKAKRNPNAPLEIKDIKESYALQFHYLEKLMGVKY
jgi:hypothetical protein